MLPVGRNVLPALQPGPWQQLVIESVLLGHTGYHLGELAASFLDRALVLLPEVCVLGCRRFQGSTRLTEQLTAQKYPK